MHHPLQNPAPHGRHNDVQQYIPPKSYNVRSTSTSPPPPSPTLYRDTFRHQHHQHQHTTPFKSLSVSKNLDEENGNYEDNLNSTKSLGFAVNSTAWLKHDNDLIAYLNVANNNNTVIAYPATAAPTKNNKAPNPPSKGQSSTKGNKTTAPKASANKPATPSKGGKQLKGANTGGVHFTKSGDEHSLIDDETRKKIQRRQTGRPAFIQGKLSLTTGKISEDEEDEGEEIPEPVPALVEGKAPKASSKSTKKTTQKTISPKGSDVSGKAASQGSGARSVSPNGSGKELPTPPDSNLSPKGAPSFENPSSAGETGGGSEQYSDCIPDPDECAPTEGDQGDACCPPPPCDDQEQDGTPKTVQAKLIQCCQTDYPSQGQQSCCCCYCRPRKPLFSPCPCRRCRVYHYCFNILNRSKVRPEDMFVGLHLYESELNNIQAAMDNGNFRHGGAHNWESPPEGYDESRKESMSNENNPLQWPTNEGGSCDPAYVNPWLTEYGAQFKDFSSEIRKSVSRYPTYENGELARGGNRGGASRRCCGGGGQQQQSQMRKGLCFDSRNRDSGSGNYVQIPEEVRRIGKLEKNHSCNYDLLCSSCPSSDNCDWAKRRLLARTRCCTMLKTLGCCPIGYGELFEKYKSLKKNASQKNKNCGEICQIENEGALDFERGKGKTFFDFSSLMGFSNNGTMILNKRRCERKCGGAYAGRISGISGAGPFGPYEIDDSPQRLNLFPLEHVPQQSLDIPISKKENNNKSKEEDVFAKYSTKKKNKKHEEN